MSSCMWAKVHLSKGQRVHRNMEVESIQKGFTTVQSQIQNIQGEEHYGLTEQEDWTESPWKSL